MTVPPFTNRLTKPETATQPTGNADMNVDMSEVGKFRSLPMNGGISRGHSSPCMISIPIVSTGLSSALVSILSQGWQEKRYSTWGAVGAS